LGHLPKKAKLSNDELAAIIAKRLGVSATHVSVFPLPQLGWGAHVMTGYAQMSVGAAALEHLFAELRAKYDLKADCYSMPTAADCRMLLSRIVRVEDTKPNGHAIELRSIGDAAHYLGNHFDASFRSDPNWIATAKALEDAALDAYQMPAAIDALEHLLKTESRFLLPKIDGRFVG
jgi:hypothetical protein